MPLKLVYKANDISEAGIIIAYLKSHGINAQTFDEQINTIHPGGPIFAPVRVVVDDYDFDKALEYIEMYNNGSASS